MVDDVQAHGVHRNGVDRRWSFPSGSATMRVSSEEGGGMSEVTDAEIGEIDLAVVAYRDEGDWDLAELPERTLDSVETIAKELRRYPGENGALALISVAEDFAMLVRAQGSLVRVLLSDVTAATDWSLARSAVDHIGIHVDVEDDQVAPAGDLAICADLGLPAREMGALLDDEELYPEEILSEVASQVGFGSKFDELVGLG
jgi:putative tRNA adenosine deaminase-associated protein